MIIIITRSKALTDQIAPQLALQRFTEQLTGGRISLTDHAIAIQYHYAAGQQIKQVLQPRRQAGLLGQLTMALGMHLIQLRLQCRHLLLK